MEQGHQIQIGTVGSDIESGEEDRVVEENGRND